MSTDTPDDDENQSSTTDRSGKGRAGGGGGGVTIVQKSAATVTAIALAITQAKGANATQIGEIVSGWKHLTGAELIRVLMDFSTGVAKASAQPIVDWLQHVRETQGVASATGAKGYAVVSWFFHVLRQLQDPRARAELMERYRLGPGYG